MRPKPHQFSIYWKKVRKEKILHPKSLQFRMQVQNKNASKTPSVQYLLQKNKVGKKKNCTQNHISLVSTATIKS